MGEVMDGVEGLVGGEKRSNGLSISFIKQIVKKNLEEQFIFILHGV